MNPFSEQHKTLSNLDLLRIINSKEGYKSEAVESAKLEISNRNLSEKELNEAKNEIAAVELAEEQKALKKKEQKEKVLKSMTYLLDLFNPGQKSIPTEERTINSIAIVFGLISLYRLYSQFGFVLFMFTDSYAEWDMSIIGLLIPLFHLPVATVLFWLRKKTGWALMVAFLSYSTMSAFGLLIMNWNMEPLGNTDFDNLFPQVAPITQLMVMFFYGGTLWMLSKKEIREHYEIDDKTTFATIGLTAILITSMIAPYL